MTTKHWTGHNVLGSPVSAPVKFGMPRLSPSGGVGPGLPAYPIQGVSQPQSGIQTPGNVSFGGGRRPVTVAPQNALNQTATDTRTRRATITAEHVALPVIYGRSETGGKIFAAGVDADDNLVLGVAWCLGPSTEIETIFVNASVVVSGTQAASGYQYTHYLGEASQAADAWLSSVISGYSDNLVYQMFGQSIPVTYSVFKVTKDASNGFPRFSARIKGREVYDPRAVDPEWLTEHMANPALSRRVVVRTGTYYWATIKNGTRFYINGVLSFTADAWEQGTITLTKGQEVYADQPMSIVSPAGYTLIPLNALSKDFCWYLNRNPPTQNTYWCAEDTTTIRVFVGTGAALHDWTLMSPATTVVANRGLHNLDGIPSTSDSHTIRVMADKPIGWFTTQTGADAEVLNPMGHIAISRIGRLVGDAGGVYYRGYRNCVVFAAEGQLLSQYPVADGSGGDSESGIPIQMMADRYLIPHPIADYVLVALEPQQIIVTDNQTYTTTWVVPSNTSANNPFFGSHGGEWGADPIDHNGPVYFESNGRFFLRTNTTPNTDEYTCHGWLSHYESEQLPLTYSSNGYRYSQNPTLGFSDFFTSNVFGAGRSVDWDTVASAASWNYSYITGTAEPYRRMGLTMDRISPTQSWIDTLRAHAGVFLHTYGSLTRFIQNKKVDETTIASITESDIIENSLNVSKRGVYGQPTVVRIRYTDTSQEPWSDQDAVAYASGVLSGTKPWDESVVRMPGIQTYSQAYREAVSRLNSLRMSDVEIDFEAFESAMQWQIGQVFKLTHSIGFTSKTFRILDKSQADIGKVRITAAEYDACQYCSSVADTPARSDTTLPAPNVVPTPTGLVLSEEKYQSETGVWYSRIRANWNRVNYLFGHYYEIVFEIDGNTIDQKNVTEETTTTPPLQVEQILKVINVRVRAVSNVLAVQSGWLGGSITPLGKYALPVWPPTAELTGFEVGGEVRLYWTAADDLAINWYEVRYGTVNGTYNGASVIDRVDTLRCTTKDIPEGLWRFYVDVVDNIGQYSGQPLVIDIQVTSDRDAFRLTHEFTSPTFINNKCLEFKLDRKDPKRRFVSDDGRPVSQTFTLTPMSTNYPDIMHTYHSAFPTHWISEFWDLPYRVVGSWNHKTNVRALWGRIQEYIWVYDKTHTHPPLSFSGTYVQPHAYYGEGWAARVQVAADPYSTLYCEIPGMAAKVSAEVVSERGTLTTTTNPAAPANVKLGNPYVGLDSVVATPINTNVATVAVVDNINVSAGTFDVYAFNLAGDLVAAQVAWEWKGV